MKSNKTRNKIRIGEESKDGGLLIPILGKDDDVLTSHTLPSRRCLLEYLFCLVEGLLDPTSTQMR